MSDDVDVDVIGPLIVAAYVNEIDTLIVVVDVIESVLVADYVNVNDTPDRCR